MLKGLAKVAEGLEVAGVVTIGALLHITASDQQATTTAPVPGAVSSWDGAVLPPATSNYNVTVQADNLNLMSEGEWNSLTLEQKLESLDRRPTRVR